MKILKKLLFTASLILNVVLGGLYFQNIKIDREVTLAYERARDGIQVIYENNVDKVANWNEHERTEWKDPNLKYILNRLYDTQIQLSLIKRDLEKRDINIEPVLNSNADIILEFNKMHGSNTVDKNMINIIKKKLQNILDHLPKQFSLSELKVGLEGLSSY
ncbi:hypothetical protein M5X00_13650 [Paenibacillus alvei]|uniref:Uncharacterized protein n=2 Tax=Paenibacillus alvei TaxID=44250 RepID=A0ABT4GXE2_PAEAL|nr:hypothetical protein [Paenibacillus alvei]EJW19653.1 hypothetical protein PAV_1c06360 [Paenibacillus alvei DSM 29]MCY7485029.1 hypothetical protein [Paenibacillus alvei]MCY9542009.1 hypothetical protein [Paenibacillus alvei]MCY9735223.1 hypothetical protein [Paenibacillus alvei]MCY9755287.1 hypothetical protein [Paenibacillus alvei]